VIREVKEKNWPEKGKMDLISRWIGQIPLPIQADREFNHCREKKLTSLKLHVILHKNMNAISISSKVTTHENIPGFYPTQLRYEEAIFNEAH